MLRRKWRRVVVMKDNANEEEDTAQGGEGTADEEGEPVTGRGTVATEQGTATSTVCGYVQKYSQ